eukprot:gene37252-45969_t
MFPFFSRSKMSEAPEVNPAPAKTQELHPLDALTGGAFSAATSGERASRIRDWLTTQPAPEQLQEVFKELSGRDKGAARAVRERLDEIRRAKGQEAIAAEWASHTSRRSGSPAGLPQAARCTARAPFTHRPTGSVSGSRAARSAGLRAVAALVGQAAPGALHAPGGVAGVAHFNGGAGRANGRQHSADVETFITEAIK